MQKNTQVELLQELVELHDNKAPYLTEPWTQVETTRYTDAERFQRERERLFLARPLIAAHVSELPEPGSYKTMELVGKPLLLVRDESGAPRCFINVCRHRGAQLVGEASGCKHRFSCPYHAWTWNSSGELIGVPHEKTGFPELDREAYRLTEVAVEERAGWIWVRLSGEGDIDVAAHLGELDGEFARIDAGSHVVFDTTVRELKCNWKILVEGGLEAYHFRVAHRGTIAPLFLDNLSSYQCVGRHIRSVLPRSTLPELAGAPSEDWDINKHANLLYSLLPGSQFLVQEDHFVWIQGIPVAPDRTLMRLSTMIPVAAHTPEKQSYWRRNHDLTIYTLDEDFELGEAIQRGLDSGANPHLNFGRFEGALAKFNATVDEAIA
ncbi:MAG: SRPBCC family protein [Halieaceae bacterium]|jgi:phenylpropionate dioxygenase-like ring-hydroxylating dioxygenase large terminal subunit|nr:SRPBCC family protein [Halieaceae bacterium]